MDISRIAARHCDDDTWRLDSESLAVMAVFEQRLLLGYVEGRPNEGDKVPPTINFITI